MADVFIDPVNFSQPVSSVSTTFSDSFNRSSGEVGLNWGVDNLGGGLIPQPRVGTLTDSQQGLILGSQGAGGKSDIYFFFSPANITGVFGLNQFCQFDLVSEQGVSSFCGPSVAISLAVTLSAYGAILRNGAWRLSRFLGGVNTDLIAPSALAFPCTLRVEVLFNGAVSNTVTVKRNGVQIGQVVDSSGIIQATGIPGMYVGCPSAGDSSQWRNFAGGAL